MVKVSVTSLDGKELLDSNLENSAIQSAASNALMALKKREEKSLCRGTESLEILRYNLQSKFNKDLKDIFLKYSEIFFQPAIQNIKNNTNEVIDDHQIEEVCKKLLENYFELQYSSSLTNKNAEKSLLHQALKRKRTDSENENFLKRQLIITSAKTNNYINNSSTKPTSLNSATMSSPRSVFHLISSTTNRNPSHPGLVSFLTSKQTNIAATTVDKGDAELKPEESKN